MRSISTPGGNIETLRVDISEDGEPTRSVEVFSEVHRGKRRTRIRIGNTTGESYTYTYPGRGYDVGDYMSSAMRKDWWMQKCSQCQSTERAVRSDVRTYHWAVDAGRTYGVEPCDYYWHTTDKED